MEGGDDWTLEKVWKGYEHRTRSEGRQWTQTRRKEGQMGTT